ncbi:hypothetical protein HanHA300_Chr08g0277371 [Helianthus annuus]|nr:hypothetical protein HanHA300_Chr08g0277371 [Helianthus annuus]
MNYILKWHGKLFIMELWQPHTLSPPSGMLECDANLTRAKATTLHIAIAMKLPVDLNDSMQGVVDQAAKLGSMAFMCTMMANLLPSLAAMESKELLTNIIALGVLVITLVVNVSIQLETGVVTT